MLLGVDSWLTLNATSERWIGEETKKGLARP
jgi:hypothetical protein